jgi:hypothetical protein
MKMTWFMTVLFPGEVCVPPELMELGEGGLDGPERFKPTQAARRSTEAIRHIEETKWRRFIRTTSSFSMLGSKQLCRGLLRMRAAHPRKSPLIAQTSDAISASLILVGTQKS